MRARIVVLPGDGIGPEVTREAVRVLDAVADAWGHELEFTNRLIGAAAIEATGQALPADTAAVIAHADAVLLGAVGDPKFDRTDAKVRPEQGLLALRKLLGLFANLRPVNVHAAGARVSPLRAERLVGVDLLFVRELTGGIYFGPKARRRTPDGGEQATDVCSYSTVEIERVTRTAARLAQGRRGKLTSIDKANVLETSRLWRAVVTRVVSEAFPDLELEHLLVDAAAMHLLQRPAEFDVVVTENMFGDILTDEAAVLAGSIGLLPSAALGLAAVEGGHGRGLYEPVHGSAPQLAGRDVANPIGAILSGALLLRHSLGLEAEARQVEAAVAEVLESGLLPADIAPAGTAAAGTAAFGAAVAARAKQPEASHV
ncbi:MAG: 3-isopropylmalate dehydrogenase [Longimicrobiales bacterium]